MKPISIQDHIGIVFDEWFKAISSAPSDTHEVMRLIKTGKLETFEFFFEKIPHDLITPRGKNMFREAVHAGLETSQKTEKISFGTAYECLLRAFRDEIENAQTTGTFSEGRVEKQFLSELQSQQFSRKIYCIPITFSRSATKTNFGIGPIRFQSTAVFSKDFENRKRAFLCKSKNNWHYAADDCWNHISSYDHVLFIEIEDFEKEMAWQAAQNLSEIFLNLIRVFYGFHKTKGVKSADENFKQVKSASLILSDSDGLDITLSHDWAGAHIDDEHVSHFCSELEKYKPFFAHYLNYMLSTAQMDNPIRTRLRQANSLIAQAFSEPHLDIKLIRLITALEKLAGLSGQKKSAELGNRCAYFSTAQSLRKRVGVYHSIRGAYLCRNYIVHDVTPAPRHLVKAFYRLDEHLSDIFFGFVFMYATLASEGQIQSTKSLRNVIKQRLGNWRHW